MYAMACTMQLHICRVLYTTYITQVTTINFCASGIPWFMSLGHLRHHLLKIYNHIYFCLALLCFAMKKSKEKKICRPKGREIRKLIKNVFLCVFVIRKDYLLMHKFSMYIKTSLVKWSNIMCHKIEMWHVIINTKKIEE